MTQTEAPTVDEQVIGDPGRAAREVAAAAQAHTLCWPDTAVDAAEAGGLVVRSASVRGVAHRCSGTPRQDAYSAVWQQDSAALVVTVCDGVGSFDSSHEAAALAAARLPDLLRPDPDTGEPDWAQAFTAVSAGIDVLSAARGAPMATTAVCARITRRARYLAEIAWVGDSAAYLLTESGWSIAGGTIKTIDGDGSPLSSATAALPSAAVEFSTCTVEFDAGDALFVMTDGVADPLGAGHGEVGAALASWWRNPPGALDFAAQVGFARRSFDDDRTVVGVWPATPQGDR